jgi:TetR/AcrR family transcriptional regulator
VKTNRRQQILEVLASELESRPGTRITTARLAAAVGVSEAALYRHFPSKAKMFEALIEFAEDSIFSLFNQVMQEQKDARTRCLHLTTAMLKFAERNPGIARILVGDVLVGEHDRLRQRVSQLFARVETQFKQALREEALDDGSTRHAESVAAIASVLLAVMAGRLDQFVRTDFVARPTADWDAQWQLLCGGLFSGDAPRR